jgi:hypothetical protein
MPEMPVSFVESITKRYIELYSVMTGKAFKPRSYEHVVEEIENNIKNKLINFE